MAILKTPCLYTIRHRSGAFYVGSTRNMARRWSTHRAELRNNRHSNRRLQAAWNRDGEDAFEFRILAVIEPDELHETENRLLARVVGTKECYNMAKRADKCFLGRAHTAESRERTAAAHRGKKHSPEHCERIAAGLRAHKRTAEHGRKIGEANRRRVVSAETRQRMAEAHRGLKQSPQTVAQRVATIRARYSVWPNQPKAV